MKTFFFIMQHNPTVEQVDGARAMGAERVVAFCAAPQKAEEVVAGVEYLGKTGLLNVPDDPILSRDWFVQRAGEILAAVGPQVGDVVMASGQGQLMNAVAAQAKAAGCERVEAVTRRESVDAPQLDGSVKKVSVFRHNGFRPVYDF